MLTETKWKILLDLINSSSKEELIWINGYLSGLVAQGNLKQEQPTSKPTVGKITIAYGTETGNSKKLADTFFNRDMLSRKYLDILTSLN